MTMVQSGVPPIESDINVSDYVIVLKRRWMFVAIPAILGTALALGIATILPPVYSSSARILVESQQIPSDLARSTVSADANERVQVISQRLSTRQNMLDIAARFEVFPAQSGMSPTDIVEQMRSAMEIRSVGLAQRDLRSPVTASLITITFRADRPQIATRVANELLSQVIAENARQRSARATETLAFFDTEVARLDSELTALDRQITNFKNDNASALPDSLGFRRDELSRLQQRMFEREALRISLEEEKQFLERSLSIGADLSQTPASPEERELESLRRSLAQARGLYADSHPAVRSLVARLEALESTVRSGVVDAESGAPVSGQAAETLRRIEVIESRLGQLVDQIEIETARMARLEESIARTPEVEATLNALQREFETLQLRFQEAVLKQAEAKTGERLEVNRQAERFEVIEQPQLPESPDSPNRPLIIAAGAVGSTGIGFAMMVLAELLNRSIYTVRDLERRLDIRPIVAIPVINTTAELRRRRWMWRFLVFGVLVIIPISLWLIDQYYRPLPYLATRVMTVLGIDDLVFMIERRLGL